MSNKIGDPNYVDKLSDQMLTTFLGNNFYHIVWIKTYDRQISELNVLTKWFYQIVYKFFDKIWEIILKKILIYF